MTRTVAASAAPSPTTLALVASLVALGGCDLISEGRDLIGDLTNPLVTQALVLGVQPPDETSEVDLPSEYSEGTAATVFLADAAEVDDLENAPISGATVLVETEELSDLGQGAYGMEPGPLAYASGSTWTVSVTLSGDTATAAVDLPPAATFDVPETQTVNTGLTIDLSGQEYDSAIVVVLDQEGEVVYDNTPQDVKALYDFTRGDSATTVDIPAEAFPQVGPYLIGVAGIRTTTGRDSIEGMNTALSTMMAGQLRFEPVAVAP